MSIIVPKHSAPLQKVGPAAVIPHGIKHAYLWLTNQTFCCYHWAKFSQAVFSLKILKRNIKEKMFREDNKIRIIKNNVLNHFSKYSSKKEKIGEKRNNLGY